MENFKRPAHAFTAKFDGENTEPHYGFTKLELASLMIAANMAAPVYQDGLSDVVKKDIAIQSVSIAKAVLQEANK